MNSTLLVCKFWSNQEYGFQKSNPIISGTAYLFLTSMQKISQRHICSPQIAKCENQKIFSYVWTKIGVAFANVDSKK